TARTQPTESPELDRVIASNLFHPFTLGDLAKRLGWRANLAGNGAVTLDGNTLFGPRDPAFLNGGTLGWCPECGACTGSACDNAWAKLDDRAMRAVVTARGTTIGDLREVYLPFYVQTGGSSFVKDEGSFTQTYPGSSVPVKVFKGEPRDDPG